MQRDPVHRERQTAGRALKREDEDYDHRAVQKQHEQREESGEPIEGDRASLVHHSSLRMSTMRLSTLMITIVAQSRMTALAAAGGNCRALSRVAMILPAEAICPPPITLNVM